MYLLCRVVGLECTGLGVEASGVGFRAFSVGVELAVDGLGCRVQGWKPQCHPRCCRLEVACLPLVTSGLEAEALQPVVPTTSYTI